MGIKLFVTDMDGTLLNDDKKISIVNEKKIRQAMADGMIFTMASGRAHKSLMPYAKFLNLPENTPIISYNGAMARTVGGKDIFANYISPELIHQVLDYCKEIGVYVHSYSNEGLFYHHHCRESDFYEEKAGIKGQAVGDDLYNYTEKVPKMLAFTWNPEDLQGVLAKLQDHFGDALEMFPSSPVYIEIVMPGADKGSAVHKLAKMLDISLDKVLTIGDNSNDVSMLKAVQHGVAMGNATPDAAAVAHYHVSDYLDDGLAEAIDRFFYDK